MRKLYFFIIVVIFCLNGNSQIINIPDANFKAKLLEADVSNNIASSTYSYITPMKIDVNNDGEIEINEVALVKRLDVSSSNINSISGIELFSNLKRLNCSNNQLIIIDLNNLSLLKYLDCSHNLINSLQIQNIDNSIDYLDCSYNSLTSITFPNFYEFLDSGEQYIVTNCSHNQLNIVNFNSVNPYEQLSNLDLSYNNLTSITFPYMGILGSLSLSNNPLLSVDFSNLSITSQNPDFSYGGLSLNNTNLTSVTIPFRIDIASGSSISNNQYLTNINIKNDKFNGECYPEFDENGEETGNMICNFITINNNAQLSLICCDDNEVSYYSNIVPTSVQVNSTCSLNISNQLKELFSIYPNPASSTLNITSNNNETLNSVTIHNMLGQKLINLRNQNSIDISNLSNGTYFITIETDKGKRTKKIIKN